MILNNNRQKILLSLIKYFEEQGRVLTYQEYAQETGTPIRAQAILQVFGTWAKLERLIMTNKQKPVGSLNTDEVLAEANKAAYDAAAAWKAASEDQDAKALKEAEAQVVAEKLTANAATPEGANANKIAIAGKLPKEQQDLSAMGTTVKINPTTLEQVVTDVDPELVSTVAVAEDKTPVALRAAVAAEVKEGKVPVDKSTAGGSKGQPSTDTLNALDGAEKAPAKK